MTIVKSSNEVLAVVVTYYRHALLRRCLEKLISQSRKCDILVINNSPEDELTLRVLSDFMKSYSNVACLHAERNLGGAGGFRRGIEIAMSRDYEYTWLLDDDAFPESNCLEKLYLYSNFNSSDSLGRQIGFYCSLVLTEQEEICQMNLPVLSKSPFVNLSSTSLALEIKQCSFVSVLVRKSVLAQAGLPVEEMFIGGDDLEYTRRISKFIGFGLVCLDSIVRHSESSKLASFDQAIVKSNIARKKREFENYFATLLAHGDYYLFCKNIISFFAKLILIREKRPYLIEFVKSIPTITKRVRNIALEIKDIV